MLSAAALNVIMAEVQLAPSAHNTQPALWSFDGVRFTLTFNSARALASADPQNFDLFLSLGAQISGLELALLRQCLAIERVEREGDAFHLTVRPKTADERAEFGLDVVERRKTYRGKFQPMSVDLLAKLRSTFADPKLHLVIESKDQIKQLSIDYDNVTLKFMRDAGYLAELYSWLRFSKTDANWSTDGLNADAMGLSWIEAIAAKRILSPKVFPTLDQTGVAKVLIEEAPKNGSASAFLILLVDQSQMSDPVALGQRFYREWLRATELGVSLCPVSNLVDDQDMKSKLEQRFAITAPQTIFKIFRAGVAKGSGPGRYRLDLANVFKNLVKEPS